MLSLLKENLGVETAIRQASSEARADMHRLDSRTLRELSLLYEDTRLQLGDDILVYVDAQGNLTVQVLQALLAKVDATLAELHRGYQELLLTGLTSAAEIGVDLWYLAGLKIASKPLVEDAVQRVQSFTADGLRLTDRLVRLEQQTRWLIADTLMQQIMAGNKAGQTVQALLKQGKQAPPDLAAQALLQRAEAVACCLGTVLLTGQDSPYRHALRLLRTELNRAHVEAYRAAMATYPRVVAERLIVSPNDCHRQLSDIHTQVDLYGLGVGVYPVGKAPWPQHPNTLSFIEAVFADEIARDQRG
jgi:hypothetical protein